jgi:hypothetical protein
MSISFDPAHNDEDFDPDHPDFQHEPPEVCTSDPADLAPGEGEADPGDLPGTIPDPPPEG